MKPKKILLDITGFEHLLDELAKEAFPRKDGTGNKKRTAEALIIHGIKTMTPGVLRDSYFDYLKEL